MSGLMTGKTVLITGATAGIGRATAVQLARQGAEATLIGRDPDKTARTAADIRTQTGNTADPASATAAIRLCTCNQTDAQRWCTPGDGTIRVFGKCLDVRNGATGNGTEVQLFDRNGTAAQ